MPSRSNVGLSRFAQLSLAATALAPVLIVWAAATYRSTPVEAGAAVVVALLLVLICLAILSLARREIEAEPLVVKKASRLDKDALAFLVTYALPLVASNDRNTNFIALFVFVIIVGFVLVQLQILHVNPLLGLFGFHFYQVESPDGDTAVLLSRSRQLPNSGVSGQRLAPALWLVM